MVEERGGKEKLEGGGKLEAWMEHVEGVDDDSWGTFAFYMYKV